MRQSAEMVQIVPRSGSTTAVRLLGAPAVAATKSAPQSGETAGDATGIGGLLGIIRRNLWKIIFATLLGTTLALTYLAIATPAYTATASLFVDPRSRRFVSEEVTPNGYSADLALVESQVSILTSDTVLRRVVEKLNLAADVEFAPPPRTGLIAQIKSLVVPRNPDPDTTVQAIASLAQNVKVKRAQKTYVVDLDVTSSSATKAQAVAQAVVDAYLADQTAAKTAEAKRANELLEKRLGELRDKLRDAETRVDDFKRSNKIVTSEGGVVNEQQLTRMNGELVTARAVVAEAKARQDQIAATVKSGAGPEALPDAVKSSLIQRLREQYAQVARREAALASQLQPKHPVMIDVRSQLAEVKSQIGAELKRIATAAQSEYQIAQSREREMAAQLDRAKDEVTRTNTAQIKLRELDQDVAASRELLRLFLNRAKETQEQQNVSTPDARVITAPSIPSKPSKPLTWLVLALGLFGGMGLGLASALVTDHMDQSLRTAGELAPQINGKGVSTIPALPRGLRLTPGGSVAGAASKRIEAAQFSDLLAALTDVGNADAGQYRQSVLRLLGKIKGPQRPGQPHTILIASPTSRAGNSATTLSLAYAAALGGERVLLIDAVSSDPALSKVFASGLKPSSVVVLDNKEHLSEITTRDARSGLTFLPIALADLRALKSAQRRRLVAGLNALMQDYDLVFIDAGAVLEDESSIFLLPIADQMMIVARSGGTTRPEVRDMLDVLSPGRDKLTGGILTMA